MLSNAMWVKGGNQCLKGDYLSSVRLLDGDMVSPIGVLTQADGDHVTPNEQNAVTNSTEIHDDLWPNLAERARFVIATKTPDRGRFRTLADASGISADTWKSFWYGRQRATEEMLAYVCCEWPEMAFWVATGLTDLRHGHVSPPRVGQVEPYPMRSMPKTAEYFKVALKVVARRMADAWPSPAEMLQLEEAEEARREELGYAGRRDESALLQELATTVEGIQVTDEDARPLIARLLAELQAQRGWGDRDMAETLDISEAAYKHVKAGAVDLLTAKQQFRIFDRWGYDRVRSALLAVLPDEWAQRITELDNQRGRRSR